ncbi:Hypothetical predicted protein [Pelobates cultripes]|uniref:Uncharacterized protein n=1 Tax=Pelobates cultripes TaxID=61616 RepID=A0AAD1VV74_PELCU|nr:Hypothetical predicted protein [Pelobates cultripes]
MEDGQNCIQLMPKTGKHMDKARRSQKVASQKRGKTTFCRAQLINGTQCHQNSVTRQDWDKDTLEERLLEWNKLFCPVRAAV